MSQSEMTYGVQTAGARRLGTGRVGMGVVAILDYETANLHTTPTLSCGQRTATMIPLIGVRSTVQLSWHLCAVLGSAEASLGQCGCTGILA